MTYAALAVISVVPFAPIQIAGGISALAFVVWKDTIPSERQIVISTWIVWSLQRVYVPTIVEDAPHATDMTAFLLGFVFFGLGLWKTVTSDPNVYRAATVGVAIACLLPGRQPKGYLWSIWSSAAYAAAAAFTKSGPNPTHVAAASAWILFCRPDYGYLVGQIGYLTFLAYATTQNKKDKEEKTSAAPHSKKPKKQIVEWRPVLAAPPLVPQSVRPVEIIDEEARNVEPFSFDA